MQKTNHEKFRIEKVIKKNEDKLYVKGKGCDNSFNSWSDNKKILSKMSQYFPEPYEPIGGDVNIKVDLLNYAPKTDLKGGTEIDTSNLASKSDLVSFALI